MSLIRFLLSLAVLLSTAGAPAFAKAPRRPPARPPSPCLSLSAPPPIRVSPLPPAWDTGSFFSLSDFTLRLQTRKEKETEESATASAIPPSDPSSTAAPPENGGPSAGRRPLITSSFLDWDLDLLRSPEFRNPAASEAFESDRFLFYYRKDLPSDPEADSVLIPFLVPREELLNLRRDPPAPPPSRATHIRE